MNIVIMDGQGGGVGRTLVELLKKELPQANLIAVGTNALATAAMLRAGADTGATGENAVVVCARQAQLIIGPIGIVLADAMLGEITPAMAAAVAASPARKVLVPVSRCNVRVAGCAPLSMAAAAGEAVRLAAEFIQERTHADEQ